MLTGSGTSSARLGRWAWAATDAAILAQRGLRRRMRRRGLAPLDEAGLADRLQMLGVTGGRTVLVHSGWGALSQVCAVSPTRIIEILRDAVAPGGTLAMPVFPLNGSMSEYLAGTKGPLAVRHQPARTGLLCELFRRTNGVVHSLHPTHPVCAMGPAADELIADHLEGDLPFGPKSPWAKLAETDGLIVGLGVNYRWFSSFHLIESCCLTGDNADLFFDPIVKVDCTDTVRGRWVQPVRPFRAGVKRCFFRIYRHLKRSGGLREAYHGHTAFQSVEAAVLSNVLRQQADRWGPAAVLPGRGWRMAERLYLIEY